MRTWTLAPTGMGTIVMHRQGNDWVTGIGGDTPGRPVEVVELDPVLDLLKRLTELMPSHYAGPYREPFQEAEVLLIAHGRLSGEREGRDG